MTRASGFTILEAALVMAVIVVMAAIAVPIALNAQVEARETKLRGTLRELRTAVHAFEADCGGYPCQLADLMSYTPPNHSHSPLDGSRIPLDPADFRGPYLIPSDGEMPQDPILCDRRWCYSRATGKVSSLAPGTATDGTRYSEW